MKETTFTSEMTQIVESNNGLKMYLNGLSTGHEATPRSNLYNLKGKTEMLEPDDILNRWKTKLSGLEHGDHFEQEVFQFDSSQLEKWGPQGQVAPIQELMEEVVLPTFSRPGNRTRAFSTENWERAKCQVSVMLQRAGANRLDPIAYTRVVDDMRARDTLESNSGWPLFTRRSKPEVVKQSIEEAERGLWKTYPAIALFRNYNRKTRLVWMFPMSANLVEGSFFQPLQSALMKSQLAESFLAPWKGFEQVRTVVGSIYAAGNSLAASDFTATDAHFQLSATMEVFDVIKYCFKKRHWDALEESLRYMHSIPLVVGINKMITGNHGVSSGSNWTNFVETIFDLVLGLYVAREEFEAISGYPVYDNIHTLVDEDKIMTSGEVYTVAYAIGDDMTWLCTEESYDPDFPDYLDKYGRSVGQEIKAEKTTNDRDKVKTLQRLFQRGYLRPDGQIRAVYSTIRALKSLVYPERFHKPELWTKDMEVIRAIMILENCVDHPLYEEFCRFVAAGDPYLVEFCKKSAGYQDSQFRKSKLIPGLNTTYNQERRNSEISRFETVKFCSKL